MHFKYGRHEPTLIKDIVKHISNKMVCQSSKNTEVAIIAEDVVTIGIWGMGGIGKTNLARAVYDHFSGQLKVAVFLKMLERNHKYMAYFICVGNFFPSY